MIEVENVNFDRGSACILSDINLKLPKGGITALVGPNGAGKSTLLALMARLLQLQSGAIRISGKSVATTPARDMARVVAILRQDPNLSSRLRVREMVGFGRFPFSRGRLTAQDHALIENAIQRFDLTSLQDRFMDTLSGGQRQRAMIAMTYCQAGEVMLLDEPLNNLDMYYARDLMRSLRLVADEGKTIVVVLHDINQAAAHADRVVAMRNGRIVEDDATARVLKPEILEAVFGYPMDVIDAEGTPFVLHHR